MPPVTCCWTEDGQRCDNRGLLGKNPHKYCYKVAHQTLGRERGHIQGQAARNNSGGGDKRLRPDQASDGPLVMDRCSEAASGDSVISGVKQVLGLRCPPPTPTHAHTLMFPCLLCVAGSLNRAGCQNALGGTEFSSRSSWNAPSSSCAPNSRRTQVMRATQPPGVVRGERCGRPRT